MEFAIYLDVLLSRLAQPQQNPNHHSTAFWTCLDALRAYMIELAHGSSNQVKRMFRRLGLLLLLALRVREEALWISELRETLHLLLHLRRN